MTAICEASLWHCTNIVRRLRSEQTSIAIGLGSDARKELRDAYRSSGYVRTWIADDGSILGMGGVTGPLLATEGVIWLALSYEATRYPVQILKLARRHLRQILMFKHKLYADPFSADPASVRFAKRLGFVERADQEEARKVGAIAMVLSLNSEAYVARRIDRVN